MPWLSKLAEHRLLPNCGRHVLACEARRTEKGQRHSMQTESPLPAFPRSQAERWDAADPLAPFRSEFVIDDPNLIYLDGNSLGRLPAATPAFLDRVVRD